MIHFRKVVVKFEEFKTDFGGGKNSATRLNLFPNLNLCIYDIFNDVVKLGGFLTNFGEKKKLQLRVLDCFQI